MHSTNAKFPSTEGWFKFPWLHWTCYLKVGLKGITIQWFQGAKLAGHATAAASGAGKGVIDTSIFVNCFLEILVHVHV